MKRGRRCALGNDVNLVAFFPNFVFPQLQPAIRGALARLHVVFIAMPWADEMHLGFGELQTARGPVGQDHLLDLGDGDPLASRPALVQADVAVGIKLPFMPEDTDLPVADKDNAAVTVLEFREFTDELLSHASRSPSR